MKQKVEKLATREEKAKIKIGNHLKSILVDGAYLKSARIDGTTKDILNARNEEEAIKMVNDLVSNFQHSLRNKPDLFKGFSNPSNITFKEMLIHTTEDGNMYWDIDVVVNGDDVKVTAPMRLAG